MHKGGHLLAENSLDEDMLGCDSNNESSPNLNSRYKSPAGVHKMPQLLVTFYSKEKPLANTHRNSKGSSSKASDSISQGSGEEDPRMPLDRPEPTIGLLDELNAYPLNMLQSQISEAFEVLMHVSKDETSAGRGDFDQQLALLPSTRPIAYTSYIFQHAYRVQSAASLDLHAMRMEPTFRQFEAAHAVEIVLDIFHGNATNLSSYRPLGLALFDMDSTLIHEEVIDELARMNGAVDAVSMITRRAMNGEIDFTTSLQERVGMLRGVKADVWEVLKDKVTIVEGAKQLIVGLKQRGVLTGVISGGFSPMAEWLKGELGLDYAFANHVCIVSVLKPDPNHEDSRRRWCYALFAALLTSPATDEYPYPHLTGKLDPAHPIVNPEFKRNKLLELANDPNLPIDSKVLSLSQPGGPMVPIMYTFAVGDGSNDLLMLGAAGLGVAWNAKASVQERAPMRVNGPSLADLLHLLGPSSQT